MKRVFKIFTILIVFLGCDNSKNNKEIIGLFEDGSPYIVRHSVEDKGYRDILFQEDGDTLEIQIYYENNELLISFDSIGYRSEIMIIKNNYKVDSILKFRNGILKYIEYLTDSCQIDECCCDGLIYKFDSLGNIDQIFERKNNKLNGNVKQYDNNGILRSNFYMVNGKMHGIEYLYYDDGKIKFIRSYKKWVVRRILY